MSASSLQNPTLVVALGEQLYCVERPFFDHKGAGGVSDVAVDEAGLIHVLIRTDCLVTPQTDAVVSLSADGREIGRWGGALIKDAHMLAAGPDGRIAIVDRDAHEIVICKDGKRISALGQRDRPLSPFNHPTDLAFAPDGTFYVSDGYANHKIHRFGATGEYLGSFGEYGSAPGAFITPHALWVQPDGSLVVVDRENDRLQHFDPEGGLLDIWTGFVKPLDVWGDKDGTLYVTDLVPALTKLAPDGTRLGRCRPVLNAAHGICGDGHGALYLAEPSPSRVTKLTPLPSSV